MPEFDDKVKAALRSAATTVLAVAGILVAVAAVPGVSIPVVWVAYGTAAAAAARTALAWLDKNQPLYGRGSK